ncbi:MAG: hypothetical protein LBG80_18305, partial [Bacteroidales bacterium]|nr:hypothetical protein [Bacteroidales bacterium]
MKSFIHFIYRCIENIILFFMDAFFKISGRKLSDKYWSSYHLHHFILNDYKPRHFVNKVAFLISEKVTLKHMENIINNMPNDTFDLVVVNYIDLGINNFVRCFLRRLVFLTNARRIKRKNNMSPTEVMKKLNKKFNLLTINEVFRKKLQYSQVVCVFPELAGLLGIGNGRKYGIEFLAKKLVRALFLIGAGNYIFNKKTNAIFDTILCSGEYQKERYETLGIKAEVIASGSPRFDKENKTVDKEVFFKHYGLDTNKKTILWLPTHGRHICSILEFLPIVKAIENDFNIIFSIPFGPNGCYGDFPFLDFKIKLRVPTAIIVNNMESTELLGVGDYVFCDYGGSVFTAIYNDKNVLLLNAEDKYVHKLIGEDSPEVEIRKEIINFYRHEGDKLISALKDKKIWEEQKAIRRRI